MTITIQPSAASGPIGAPASKSAAQRAFALALLHKGTTYIRQSGSSNDVLAALQVAQALGANIQHHEHFIEIVSNGPAWQQPIIHCGESGLCLRMFAPIAASLSNEIVLTGTGSLLNRPVCFFENILKDLSVSATSNQGFLPLKICGPLQLKEVEIDAADSSQFLSGLLMIFACLAQQQQVIHVSRLHSRPYIDLSLRLMQLFGYAVENDRYSRFIIHPKKETEKKIDYTVEGDWSGASFLLVAGAISGSVTVKGLNVHSAQADKAILQALMMAEASLSIGETEITAGCGNLKAFHFDATDCPDLFPPLVALAAYCRGTSVIEGVSRLLHKESNRGITLQQEFGKLGVHMKIQDNFMLIAGAEKIVGAICFSHNDHRIAMALAVAALKAAGPVQVEGSEAVRKSYPDFFNDLKSLGVIVEEK